MSRDKPKSNEQLQSLIQELKKKSLEQDVKLWKRIALFLETPTRKGKVVNLYKLEKSVREDETAIVPGKVLGVGDLNKKLTIAAFKFSGSAADKINKVGKAITISELMEQNPKGSKVRIIG